MSYHGGMGMGVTRRQPNAARTSPARQKLDNVRARLVFDVRRGALTRRQAQREYKRMAHLIARGRTPPYARPLNMQTHRGHGGLDGILAVL